MFKYKTRSNASPQGKPRVYFTCHPDDFKKCFEKISDQVLEIENCAVFYYDSEEEYQDIETDLRQMNLFVIPVTTRLLTTKNRTMDIDLPFALEKHIPVLPLMQENGLNDVFSKRFGDIQYLNENARDDTAIPYEEKLKKFLSSILVGDELAEKIRAAFDAYIFVSYRKKDRKYAQELMRLIHKNDFCRDIATWYDEFLTPGENFNEAINDALKKSELFALVVTPNLVNEKNYVQTVEYPEAVKANKKVLPTELVETDKDKLNEMYEKIPACVDARDDAELSKSLLETLSGIAKRDNDPQHNFFIGLAYLNGIDVEVDNERAVSLITSAAESGLEEAIEKLVSMYYFGEGVKRDYYKSLDWQRKLINKLRRAYFELKCEADGLKLFYALCELGDYFSYLLMAAEANEACMEAEKLITQFQDINSHSLYHVLCVAFERRGLCFENLGKLSDAIENYLKALDIAVKLDAGSSSDSLTKCNNCEHIHKAYDDPNYAMEYYTNELEVGKKHADGIKTVESLRCLAKIYNELGDVYEACGNLVEAEKCFLECLESRKKLVVEMEVAESNGELAASYERLGDVCKVRDDLNSTREYYINALEIRKAIFDKSSAAEAHRELQELKDKRCNSDDPIGGREYYVKEFEIRRRLATGTKTVENLRKLQILYDKLLTCEAAIRVQSNYICIDSIMEEGRDYHQARREIIEILDDRTRIIESLLQLSISLSCSGHTSSFVGNLIGSKEYYAYALRILERIAKERGTAEDFLKLSNCYVRLGEISKALDNPTDARVYYNKSLEIKEKLARETGTIESYDDLVNLIVLYLPENSMLNIPLLQKFFNIYIFLFEQYPDVKKFKRTSLFIGDKMKELVENMGADEDLQSLIMSYNHLGDIIQVRGDRREAEWQYKEALELSEKLVKETGTIESRRDLSVSYNKLGDIRKACGDLNGAEEYYEKALELRKKLAEETKTVESRRDLSVSYNKLGNIRKACGDLKGAEEYYAKALELREKLAEETKTVESRRDLSLSYERLGDIRKARSDLKGAEEYYAKGLELSKQLAQETKTIEAYDDLAVSYYKCAMIKSKPDIALLTEALKIFTALAEQCPDVVRYSKNRDVISNIINKNS